MVSAIDIFLDSQSSSMHRHFPYMLCENENKNDVNKSHLEKCIAYNVKTSFNLSKFWFIGTNYLSQIRTHFGPWWNSKIKRQIYVVPYFPGGIGARDPQKYNCVSCDHQWIFTLNQVFFMLVLKYGLFVKNVFYCRLKNMPTMPETGVYMHFSMRGFLLLTKLKHFI